VVGPNDSSVLRGRVDLVEKVGAEQYLSIVLDGGTTCMVRASLRVAAHEGEQIRLSFPPDAVHLFTADGARIPKAES